MGDQSIAQLATLIGAVVSFLSVVTGFLLSKRKDKDAANTAERQQLSADQKLFIDNLKAENKELRDRLTAVEKQLFELKEVIIRERIGKEQLIKKLEKYEGSETE